jgi:hypothetical protein
MSDPLYTVFTQKRCRFANKEIDDAFPHSKIKAYTYSGTRAMTAARIKRNNGNHVDIV